MRYTHALVTGLVTLTAAGLAAPNRIQAIAGQAAGQAARQTLVAVLRGDGTLVPFAAYASGTWGNPWNTATGKASLATAPQGWFPAPVAPAEWHVQLTNGARATIHARREVRVENHCQQNWALTSDFHGQSAKPIAHHLNVGIAIAERANLEPMSPLGEKARDAQRAVALIRTSFDDNEAREITSRTADDNQADFPARVDRARVGLVFEKMFRTRYRTAGLYWYYFEASKSYGAHPISAAQRCPLVAVLRGWISEDAQGHHVLVDGSMRLTDCDRKGVLESTPVAGVTMNGRLFFVTIDHGYENESYSILEPGPAVIRRVLTTDAGGC